MQKKFFSKQILVVVLMMANLLFAKEEALIIVTGIGQETVVPDIAIISLGAQTRNESLQVAFSDNRAIMQKVLNSLEKLEINKRDIRTDDYSAYLEQNYSKLGGSKPGHYRITNNISVTVKDISLMGQVVNTAIGNGANQMYGISFVSSNIEEAQMSARKKAVANAFEKAQTLAKEAGVTINGIQKILELKVDLPSYRMAGEALNYKASNVISAGTTNVSVNVEVHYIIEK